VQNAETLLNIIRERGKRGLPLKRVYPCSTTRTCTYAPTPACMPTRGQWHAVDGMSRAKIDRLIDELHHERFRWTPVRRVQMPKKNGKLRPLCIVRLASVCMDSTNANQF